MSAAAAPTTTGEAPLHVFVPTPLDHITPILQRLRAATSARTLHPLAKRRQQLQAMHKFFENHGQDIARACAADLNKPLTESMLHEVGMCVNDIGHFLQHLDEWARPERPSKDLLNLANGVEIRPTPFGLVLVIGAWNYPVQLALMPAIAAIAAGNTVLLKPSELSPHTAALLADALPKYMDPNCFAVVNGGAQETTQLLRAKFDKIFYTGGARVARIISRAAAQHLTPVALELGGKSPVFLHDSADVTVSARRIAWGRFMNAGQTCIAPDYVLCTPEMQTKLIPALRQAILEFYGPEPHNSTNFSRIVNGAHFTRVQKLVRSADGTAGNGRIVIGGSCVAGDRFVEPTVVADVSANAPLMQEEIFGPVLPIVPVKDMDVALRLVTMRDHPLALYIFASDRKFVKRCLAETQSGAVVVNDVVMHATVTALPFGGVGESGSGAYHGKHGFDLFSHARAVLFVNQSESMNNLRYPPYSNTKREVLSFLATKEPNATFFGNVKKVFGIIRSSL